MSLAQMTFPLPRTGVNPNLGYFESLARTGKVSACSISMKGDNSMKNLFDVTLANQVKQRIDSLRIDSERQWGKMGVAQTIAHCASGLEMALGEIRPPRALMGRL